jgi:para-nitrobenzyl esterase
MNSLQRLSVRLLLAAAGAVCAATAVADPSAALTSVTVMTDKGPVTGGSSSTVSSFLGIPYAAPPVGPLRWQAPQPGAPWLKLRATKFANHCPQLPGPYGVASTTEDCLYLNVYAPSNGLGDSSSNGAKRPVMVWFHGGSNQVGLSDKFGPAGLVGEDVVVVTVNYRLGVLGFLSHPALTAESPNHVSGNYGILDQQAALRWVQRNVANFGGDPGNVTVFGQSAGGLDIHTHLASPLAAGLFQRAIIHSGAYAVSQSSMAANENRGNSFGARYGCPAPTTAACLRSISVADTLSEPSVASISGPVVDNFVLKETINAALASGRFNRVPVMEGSNHDEYRLFMGQSELATGHPLTAADYPTTVPSNVSGHSRASLLAEYPLSNFENATFAVAAIETDTLYACSSRKAIRQITNFVPVYAYEFYDPDAPQVLLAPVSFPYGSAHSSELTYLFELHTLLPNPVPLNDTQRLLSRTMMQYWTQFARTGNPNSSATPVWPAYDSATDLRQSLSPPSPYTQGTFAVDHHCAFWAPES